MRLRLTDDRGVSSEVSALAEPEQWMDLRYLWLALTGCPPKPALVGWAALVREHAGELAEALGPALKSTEAAYQEQKQAAAESFKGFRSELRRRSLSARVRLFFRGPAGWIVAAILFLWLTAR